MNSKNFSKGFSLVELMVVVAIVAILAAVAIPAYINHIMRVRQADAHNYLLDIKAAQEMYYAQWDEYNFPVSDSLKDLLSFDFDDSEFYTFSIVSGDKDDFWAKADGAAGTMLAGDCMDVSAFTEPGTCGEPIGFSFSLIFN